MEFVGRTVKKEFQGFGVFSGSIKSFDPASGFFEVAYEDGDSEEMDLSEVASLLEGMAGEIGAAEPNLRPRPGWKPKKRRRVELKRENRCESGNCSDNLMKDGCLGAGQNLPTETIEKQCGAGEDLNEAFCVNGSSRRCTYADGINLNDEVYLNDGIDLNDKFDSNSVFNSNDEFHLKEGLNLNVKFVENAKRSESIDLNLELDGDFDANVGGADVGCLPMETQKRKCQFDLNLGFDEETKSADDGCGDKLDDSLFRAVEGNPKKEICVDDKETHMKGDIANGNLEGLCFKIGDGTSVEGITGSGEHVLGDLCLGSVDGIPNEGCVLGEGFNGNDSSSYVYASCANETRSSEVLVKGVFCEAGHHVDLGNVYKEGTSVRKRRKLAGNLKSTTVLRRSTRRGAALGSAQNPTSGTSLFPATDLSSPAQSAESEGKPTISGCQGPEEQSLLPPKVQLPPSSQDLSLDGIPIPDVFSVYACLRSFSTLLFLSPFELDDFVAALKCKYPTSLFDFIHVSLLQTLRKHLECLSSEGSQSAVNCLRSLNWSLLDLITWPVFMVEYLLIHNSRLKAGFNFNCLKLFDGDYYNQSASVKVEILRCLCDDVMEVEAIRSELNRRSMAAEPTVDFDRNVNSDTSKKRRVVLDEGGLNLMGEVVDETIDGNSDECCLCKMDGSLICCDGCPAAYHSRCVGVANDLLPEGEWYCPECVIDKHKQLKLQKSLRGAELLGIDPHGRLYFSSCGYLLVSDSCDFDSSFNVYHRNDLHVVIEVLKSSNIHYGDIISAISQHLIMPVNLSGANTNLSPRIHTECSETKGQVSAICLPQLPLAHSETSTFKDENVLEKTSELVSVITSTSGFLGFEVSKSTNLLDSATMNQLMDLERPHTSSEGSAETSQLSTGIQNVQKHGSDCLTRSPRISNQSDIPGKISSLGEFSLTSTCFEFKQGKSVETSVPSDIPSKISTRKGDASSLIQFVTDYMNYYSFAQTASLVAEELMHKSSAKIKEDATMSVEEIISSQLKVILKKSVNFCWPNTQKLNLEAQKEKCGWCFSCKVPTDDTDCLFKISDKGSVLEGSIGEVAAIQAKSNKKGHLVDVICYIMSMEDRLRGFLLGPWLNAHYAKIWCKTVLNASDVASVKHLLLMIESNLHHLVLSAEWFKHVDSFTTMGSASLVVSSSVRVTTKHGVGRKRVRSLEFESNPLSSAATGLGMFWWRGGRLSRQVFSWKVLPRSLVSRAARQAGCMKIPGLLYPDSCEFAKRSKYVAWRAAVEASTSIGQLAFQVRELDLNIRWDDIENTYLLPVLDKESRKSIRSFKKVIIRRKCIEKTAVKYLLDFGKRKIIPDIVLRHGSILEDSSSERKKYWLEESHVPLHLLKAFEERRIARKSASNNSGKILDCSRLLNQPSRKRGFSHLFSKAQRSENYQCGHCNKDVLIREAVSCQYCKGFFHKRHVRKLTGSVTVECTYTCHKCQDGKHVRIGSKRRKVQSEKREVVSTNYKAVKSKRSKKACVAGRQLRSRTNKKVPTCVPLRRSARKAKYVPLQNKKVGGGKKGNRLKSKKREVKNTKKGGSWQKKRAQVYRTYWLNGLFFSGKPNDERVKHFRDKKLISLSKCLADSLNQPKCCLCGDAGYTSDSNFIACDFCGDWFHGDAYGLNAENIGNLIGFRCHTCRKRSPPVCPNLSSMRSEEVQLDEVKNNAGTKYAEEVSNDVTAQPSSEAFLDQKSHSDNACHGSCLVDSAIHKELQSGVVTNSDKIFIPESTLEAINGHLLITQEQKEDTIQCSDLKDSKPDFLHQSSGSLMLEENLILSGCVTFVEADMDVLDKELASLGQNEAYNGSVKSLVDSTLVNSLDLHPQTNLTSSELLDEGGKSCKD